MVPRNLLLSKQSWCHETDEETESRILTQLLSESPDRA